MLPELLAGLGHHLEAELGMKPDYPQFSGTHFAANPIKGNVLHGDKRGLTGEGEESNRVFLPPRGAPSAVHVYENNGQIFGKHPQIVSRPHAYQVDGKFNLAQIEDEPKWAEGKQRGMELASQAGADPKTAEMVGRNEAEWGLKEAGFHGYRSKTAPGNVVLFGDVPARSLDKAKQSEQSTLSNTSSPSQVNTLQNVKSDISVAAPSKIKLSYPINSPNSHESHLANSDPAHLG